MNVSTVHHIQLSYQNHNVAQYQSFELFGEMVTPAEAGRTTGS